VVNMAAGGMGGVLMRLLDCMGWDGRLSGRVWGVL
jgi:hypothetical protein